MKRYVIVDKKIGETPLAAIQKWRSEQAISDTLPISYAGRLDPMASGKLLLLLGEECTRQQMYTNLDKEYDIEVLLDMGSDTGDALGLTRLSPEKTNVDFAVLKRALDLERGSHVRAYPAFSSKTVRGKPLFLYALEGTLSAITIPEHLEKVYRVQYVSSSRISRAELRKRIHSFLDLVPHTTEPSKVLGRDFRVDEIRAEWEKVLEAAKQRHFTILRLRVICGSGTYMRSLAQRIGFALGTEALALSITRTKIGKYLPLFCGRGVWLSMYT